MWIMLLVFPDPRAGNMLGFFPFFNWYFFFLSFFTSPIPACFADEELPLDADGAEILSETFNILSLNEIKLQAISAPAGGAAGDEPEEENMATMAKAVLQATKKKVVSQVSST